MIDANSADSPFETVGERTVEAFELLGNETRLAILLALWEATDPASPASEPALSFSALRRRVGMRHGEQFNYHLDRLVGRFVRKTEAGYTLTTSAERILGTVLAGELTDSPSFVGEQIDAPCLFCGTSTVVDYRDGILTQRCPGCEGTVRTPDCPTGVIATEYRPPVGLQNRTPEEFVQQGKTWHRHRRHSFIEGACPDCSGTVTTTVRVCDDHERDAGRVCAHCGQVHEIMVTYVCDVCKADMDTGLWNTVLTEVPVIAFFHDHGLDTKALEDELAYGVLYAAIDRTSVLSVDPLELLVRIELDGDSLTLVLDDEARVVETDERSGTTE